MSTLNLPRGADGTADQAQSADHRAHLPHRDRDHRASTCGSSGATKRAISGSAAPRRSRMLAELSEYGALYRQSRLPRSDPREHCPARRRHRLRGHRRSQAAMSSRDAAYSEVLGHEALRQARPPTRVLPAADATPTTAVTIRGRRYVELIAPVGRDEDRDRDGIDQVRSSPPPTAPPPRRAQATPIGLRPPRDDARPAAATVQRSISSARCPSSRCSSVLTIGATFLLTRRPRRADARLMRAARAVGAGQARRATSPRTRRTSWAC